MIYDTVAGANDHSHDVAPVERSLKLTVSPGATFILSATKSIE
jgi:hypothetical protein